MPLFTVDSRPIHPYGAWELNEFLTDETIYIGAAATW